MTWVEKTAAGIMILGFLLFMYSSWHKLHPKDDQITAIPTRDTEWTKSEKGFPKDCTDYSLHVGEDFEWPKGVLGMRLTSDCKLEFVYPKDKEAK